MKSFHFHVLFVSKHIDAFDFARGLGKTKEKIIVIVFNLIKKLLFLKKIMWVGILE